MQPKLDAILGKPWALQPSVLAQLATYLAGDKTALVGLQKTPAQPRTQGYISVIPIHGVIERRSSFLGELFGGTSIDAIRGAFRAAMADPDVQGVVLDIDSPGGGVGGVTELASEIRAARGQKPIYALADTTAGSAAFWLGAQAERFYVTPSGEVGSVGVYGVHMDISRALDAEGVTPTIISSAPRKTAESELAPLDDAALASIQARVDSFGDQFIGDVAKGRGISPDKVRSEYGEGASLLAKEALAAGMVDGIDTLDGVLRLMSRAARGRVAAEGETVELDALDEPAPFRERVEMLHSDAESVMAHGLVRAALRAKENRPAFSEPLLASLRSTRDAISALLPDEPVVEPPAADPPKSPAVQPPPVKPVAVAPVTPRFTHDEWIAYLERNTA